MARPSARSDPFDYIPRLVRVEEHRPIEREPVMISTLEYYNYCPRQYALTRREQTFDDNVHTMRESAAHEWVHEKATTTESDVRVERPSLRMRSRGGVRDT